VRPDALSPALSHGERVKTLKTVHRSVPSPTGRGRKADPLSLRERVRERGKTRITVAFT
jgi:hypothetical protein